MLLFTRADIKAIFTLLTPYLGFGTHTLSKHVGDVLKTEL